MSEHEDPTRTISAIPSGWKTVRLGEICDFFHGGTPSKAVPKYWVGNIPWVSPKDMHSTVIHDTIDHISGAAIRESSTRLAPSGALLIVARSGILARTVPIAVADVPVAFNQDIKVLVVKQGDVDPWFVYWTLQNQQHHLLTQGVKKGATVHSLRSGFIEGIQIPLPPLDEQRYIVDALNAQMAAVEQARTAAAAQLAAAKMLPASYVGAMFKALQTENVPLARLGHVVSALRGVTFQSGEASSIEFADSIACVTTSGVQNQVDWQSRRFIPRKQVKADEQILRAGDILVSTANSKALVGKSCLVETPPFPCSFGAFVTTLRPNEKAFPVFVAHWLRSMDALAYFFRMSSNTTNISNLRVSDLLALDMPLPSLEDQRRIAAQLTERLERAALVRQMLEAQRQEIDMLPEMLLREAFSGTLSVRRPVTSVPEILERKRNSVTTTPGSDIGGRQRG